MKLFSKRKIKALSAFTLILAIIFSTFPAPVPVMAADWAVFKDGKICADKIVYWDQMHESADKDSIRYVTKKYAISLNRYTKYDSNFSYLDPYYVDISGDILRDDGTIKKVRYSMPKATILKAANHFGITADDIANGSANLYLNPVYQLYRGDTKIGGLIEGLNSMLAAAPWSEETINNLPGFYNIEFYLTISNVYNVKIVPVDKDGNPLSGAKNKGGTTVGDSFSLSSNKSRLYSGQNFAYTLADTNTVLTKDGNVYNYSRWYYKYDKRDDGSSSLSKVSGSNNTSVSFSGPDAEDGTTLTIYMEYEPEESNIFDVQVVAKLDSKTETLQATKNVKGGTTFTYTIPNPYKTGSPVVSYNYMNSCSVKYKKGGASVTEAVSATTKIKQTLPNADPGSKVVFTLVYGTGPTPSIIPTPSAGPTPTPPIAEVIVPEPDYASMDYTTVIATGSILPDIKGSQRFTATQGVPTTESLYGETTATEYIVGYNFVKKVGIKTYPVTVRKDYILEWQSATPTGKGTKDEEGEDEEEEPEIETETVTIEQTYQVQRAYGYWEIVDFGLYEIKNAKLNNYALPDGSVVLTPNPSLYSTPAASVSHGSSESYHLTPPVEAVAGMTLPAETITSDGSTKPSVPKEDFSYNALADTGQITVRNDTVVWNGMTVMSGNSVKYDGPDINRSVITQCYSTTKDNTLYKNNQIIKATKINGSNASTGTMTYSAIASVNKPSTLTYNIVGINNVVIHTPVYCDATISANNDKWVQLKNPTPGCVELVLDEDSSLNDFTVNVSNYGYHSPKQGYYTRDFAWCLRDPSVSYLAKKDGVLRNEVKFPFDVYEDIGKDGKQTNDKFIKAGTWITIGHTTPKFYLPMWVPEGVYTVDFRSVAVNGTDKLSYAQHQANTDRANYVATDTVKVEVSGRIYGLTMYDISDYPVWQEAFRVPNSSKLKLNSLASYPDGTLQLGYYKNKSYYYTVGTCDQYGNSAGRNSKYTFPLVNGSHPQYVNQGILKTGYITRFKLTTTGELYSDADRVVVVPTFYFVDKKGKNRQQVDLWYSEEIKGKNRSLVKVGSSMDLSNIKYQTIGDLNLAIPVTELKTTASIRNEAYGKYIWHRAAMFNFSKITLSHEFRTFVNDAYTAKIKKLPSYPDVAANNITANLMTKTKQNWYGEYYLPDKVHAVPTGTDVVGYASKYGVDFIPDSKSRGAFHDNWLMDGYIIVNFNIYTIDSNNKVRLSYVNANNYKDNGNCSMWVLENPSVSKKSKDGTSFSFYAGDYIMYYANKKASDDYHSGAIY